jgi:hypothetical protein
MTIPEPFTGDLARSLLSKNVNQIGILTSTVSLQTRMRSSLKGQGRFIRLLMALASGRKLNQIDTKEMKMDVIKEAVLWVRHTD